MQGEAKWSRAEKPRRYISEVVHVFDGQISTWCQGKGRMAHLSLPSSAVLARQPFEHRLSDAVPG